MNNTPRAQKVLVTGANGFIGRELVRQLDQNPKFEPRAALRKPDNNLGQSVEQVVIEGLVANADWHDALAGVDMVVHTAARVHVMNDKADDPLEEFRRVNVAGTIQLAKQAIQAGVKRFVFLSSIKVNGEGTRPGRPYTANDDPAPIDDYGISKLEAEQALFELARNSAMEVVAIRPVLVYGPGVKANFERLMRIQSRGIILPLGSINNKRSLVYLGNLVNLIITCLDHPQAANQVFLVSDGVDLSTSQLLRHISNAMGKKSRLLPVPTSLMTAAAKLIGKSSISKRLFGSLQVDITKTREFLDWTPPISIEDAIKITVENFQLSHSGKK